MKKYFVHFVGSDNGRWISAPTAKKAKKIFAAENGIAVSSYIVASKKGPMIRS